MKDNQLLILLGLGAAAYFISNKSANSDTDFAPITAGTVSPLGHTVTETINSPAEGVDYINRTFFQQPKLITMANRKSTQGSYRIMQARPGGGWEQVGASNVKLNPRKESVKTVKDMMDTVAAKKPRSAAGNPAPWNKKYGGKK